MKTANLSGIIQAIYDYHVPESKKRDVIREKFRSFNRIGTGVRVQPYIPKEVYVILDYFGAFTSSESDFFTARAVEYIEHRAVELGVMNTILQTAGGK